MAEKINKKRCAVYCRKSVEDGLEQEFNSLDAQREEEKITSPARRQTAGSVCRSIMTMAGSAAAT